MPWDLWDNDRWVDLNGEKTRWKQFVASTKDTSEGLPTDPVGAWYPWDFYSDAPGCTSWKRRGFGCGGAVIYRVMGEPGTDPSSLFGLKGVVVYGTMKDAVAALKALPNGGALVVYERGRNRTFPEIAPSGMSGEDFKPWYHGGSTANFAILLGSPNDCCWEHANHGWGGVGIYTTDPLVIHSRKRAGFANAVYVVIPASSTRTLSPVPAGWDKTDTFPKARMRRDAYAESLIYLYPFDSLYE